MNKPQIIYCQFVPTLKKNTYVCTIPNCELGPVITPLLPIWRECGSNPLVVLTGQSEPKPDPKLWKPKKGMRDTLNSPCIHLGGKTGKLASCGCHVSDWRKEIYNCPKVEEKQCVLTVLQKKIPQPNCQECKFYEPELVQLT